MCFVAPSNICKLQRAEKDIVVYKIVRNPKYKRYFWHPWNKYLISVQSGIRGFVYRVGVLNKVVKLARIDYDSRFNIEEGYHAYSSFNEYIIECIIPKGSYYYHYDGLYVSSNIIITDKIYDIKDK